ncbi:hypothetical protein GGR44_000474 [Sphingobium fontiphilum]|uniref:Uncharacterized protein n=1 Tax=Sphingobium fontiphilum TaxID=944425 RepID=A0A7W6DCU7_9SPHN|nr:hypothetical protein [Sphingobium fontiphilum]MBB3980843.1 hypothetical protein [Sphingobium fontiphilum]
MIPEDSVDQNTADIESSAMLAAVADAWIDLNRPTSESEYLMTNLAERYENMLLPFVPLYLAQADGQGIFLQLLIKQLARAQADIFALKSAVLGRDQLVLTKDWDYRDPLQAYSIALGETTEIFREFSYDSFILPIDDSVLSLGWYDLEESGDTSWRWSGPGINSSLLLPRMFDCKVRIDAKLAIFDRSCLPESGLISVNNVPVDYSFTLDEGSDTIGVVSFEVDLTGSNSAFFMLGFHVKGTMSPQERGDNDDARKLGICLFKLAFSTLDGDAAKPVLGKLVKPAEPEAPVEEDAAEASAAEESAGE